MTQWKRSSFRVDAGTSGFIYISDSDRTVPAEDPELLSRPCRKRRPSSYDDGASREFSRAAVPVWGFHEVGRGAQGASRVAPGKLGFNGRGEGNASLLSSHGRVSGLKMR